MKNPVKFSILSTSLFIILFISFELKSMAATKTAKTTKTARQKQKTKEKSKNKDESNRVIVSKVLEIGVQKGNILHYMVADYLCYVLKKRIRMYGFKYCSVESFDKAKEAILDLGHGRIDFLVSDGMRIEDAKKEEPRESVLHNNSDKIRTMVPVFKKPILLFVKGGQIKNIKQLFSKDRKIAFHLEDYEAKMVLNRIEDFYLKEYKEKQLEKIKKTGKDLKIKELKIEKIGFRTDLEILNEIKNGNVDAVISSKLDYRTLYSNLVLKKQGRFIDFEDDFIENFNKEYKTCKGKIKIEYGKKESEIKVILNTTEILTSEKLNGNLIKKVKEGLIDDYNEIFYINSNVLLLNDDTMQEFNTFKKHSFLQKLEIQKELRMSEDIKIKEKQEEIRKIKENEELINEYIDKKIKQEEENMNIANQGNSENEQKQ